jgi:hypothetical protein
LLEDAIDTVYAMFVGVGTIWDLHAQQVWWDKTHVCYRFLVAWYLADRYPELSASYISVDGIPIKRKKVDGVDLTFATEMLQDTPAKGFDSLSGLKSNDFGRKALMMIRSSAKKSILRNRPVA